MAKMCFIPCEDRYPAKSFRMKPDPSSVESFGMGWFPIQCPFERAFSNPISRISDKEKAASSGLISWAGILREKSSYGNELVVVPANNKDVCCIALPQFIGLRGFILSLLR